MGAFRDFFTELWRDHIESPIMLVVDKLGIDTTHRRAENAIRCIQGEQTVTDVEYAWGIFDAEVKNIAEVKAAYETKKSELTAEGMLTPGDYAMGKIGAGIVRGLEGAAEGAVEDMLPVVTAFLKKKKVPAETITDIETLMHTGVFGVESIVSFLIGVTLYPAVSTATAPVWRIAEHEADALLSSALLSPDILLYGRWRKLISEEKFQRDMAKHGFSETDIEKYDAVMKFYPSPSDLVTWQAREVYEPDAIKKYGLDNEFENLELEPFFKAGMTEEQIKNYWRAHWEHASWTQVIDMLHRGQLTEEDVWDWFRLVEIPPFWRDKFIAISYNPVTRVDLRRLYKEGIYTREQVKDGYIALGNKPEIAEHLTVWTEKAYAPEDRDLTKSEILKNYRIGEASSAAVMDMLLKLGYDSGEAAWILAYEDYHIAKEEKTEEAEATIAELVAGTITYEEAEKHLEAIPLTQKSKNQYLNKAKREMRTMIKHPGAADLKRWLKAGVIDEKEFQEEMLLNKWLVKDIDRFLKEVKSAE